ncbi:MAG: YdcH family protein [Alphaproteobacteria bacterium]
MGLETSQHELNQEHHSLDRIIEKEMARPSADSLRIAQLKKRKLFIKDQLLGLQSDT